MPSFNQVPFTVLCSMELCRQYFKKYWSSNGKIQFPTKIIYAVHSKPFKLMTVAFAK